MRKLLMFVGAAVLICLAAYGAVRLLSDSLTSDHGKKAGEVTGAFAEGVASAAGERIKESLKNTPDQKLEEDARFWTRKLYPIAKGALKGQTQAVQEDPQRNEVPKLMYERGKDVAENMAKPFVKGLVEGSSGIAEEVAKTLKGIRELGDENRELIDTITRELGNLGKSLKENLPPPPPFPGPPHRPFMQRPFPGSQQTPSVPPAPGTSP